MNIRHSKLREANGRYSNGTHVSKLNTVKIYPEQTQRAPS